MQVEIDVGVGDIVFYKLEPRHLPVNPQRLWAGKVVLAHSKKCLFVVVSSLEPGYEGECETVFTSQIVRIEKENAG